jgi:hypothetical protein
MIPTPLKLARAAEYKAAKAQTTTAFAAYWAGSAVASVARDVAAGRAVTVVAGEVKPVAKFEVGKTYSCRSIGDHDCIFSFVVVARTAKQLTLKEGSRTFKRGIFIWDNVESCKPYGRYSMAPTIRAAKF